MSSDARPSVLIHATEELLEEYAFGRICEPQLGWLEEHLLICTECQSALGEIDEYIVFMKTGLAALKRERQTAADPLDSRNEPPARLPSAPRKTPWLHFTLPQMPTSKILAMAALLLVLAGTTVAWRMQSPAAMAPVATIRLIGLRGGEESGARAPSGHPLDLVIDRTDLPSGLSYRAEVVDSSGRQMWSGTARIADHGLSARVDKRLEAGTYWVRLYSVAGQLLREFGLNVE